MLYKKYLLAIAGRTSSVSEKLPVDQSQRIGFSDFINSGRVVYKDVIKNIYSQTNKKFGTEIKPPVD